MARSLCVGSCSVLLVAVIVRTAPSAVVPARAISQHARVARRVNPVATLFAALSGCRASLSDRERWRVAGAIHHGSRRYGYDPLFVVALAQVESTCRPTARSQRGAVGLIQVRPSVGRAVAEAAGLRWRGAHMLTKPLFNVHVGLRYLTQLEKRFGDPYVAVAAYNMGPNRVAGMPRHRARATAYVQKVLSHYEALLAQHGMPVTHADS
jgi:soluble lytic murein transglycosylase